MNHLPQPIAELVDVLAAMPGAVALVLGGSRALGSNDSASDWDLGVYYRGAICRSFSLDYARMHARRGNLAGATGQAAKAIMEAAHAILCERGQWVCNEKRLIEAAGLVGLNALFAQVPIESESLVQWVDLVASQLGVPRGEVTPWK